MRYGCEILARIILNELYQIMMEHHLTIEYCPKCNWLLRAAYFMQEFLTSFENELTSATLIPSKTNGSFIIHVDGIKIFDRKEYGGFPEIKLLKQMIRDIIARIKAWGIPIPPPTEISKRPLLLSINAKLY